jgi:hypothetical protein
VTWFVKRRILLFSRLSLGLFQAHSGPATILIDELDARIFERALDYLESRASRRARTSFQLMNRHDPDTGRTSEILLAPS